MFKRPLLWVIPLMALVVFVISVVYAQPPEPGLMNAKEELELTDEQIENIRDIQYNFKKEQIGLEANLKTAELELKYLLMADAPREKEIFKLGDEIGEVRKELMRNDIERKLAIRKILTKSQFEKFLKMREHWKRERMRRRLHDKGPEFCPHHRPEFPPPHQGPRFDR